MSLQSILVLFLFIIISSYDALRHHVKKPKLDYEIPKWVRKKFKSNRIPRFSPYHHKNRSNNLLTDFPRYISEEQAMYNAVKACNLPFGLLQTASKL